MKNFSMGILTKTAGIVCAAIIVLVAALAAGSYHLVAGRFARLEDKDARTQVQRAVNEINNAIKSVELVVRDWAPWDETYRFAQGDNPSFVADNLSAEAFANLNLQFIAVYNERTQLVYQQFFNPGEKRLSPADPDVAAAIAAAGPLSSMSGADPHAHVAGLLTTSSGQTLMVAAAPIVTSTFNGPIRGVLVMGRRLDERAIARFSETIQLSIRMRPHQGQGDQCDDDSSPPGAMVRRLDEQTVLGCSVLADLVGRPAATVEVILSRETFQQGLGLWRQAALSMAALGVVFIGVLLFLLNRLVLRKLVRVAAEVDRIADQGGLDQRLPVTSVNDEIDHLSERINSMLVALENYQGLQAGNERYLKEVLDSINCGVMVVDAVDRRIVDVNKAGIALLGRSETDLVGRICHQLACPRKWNQCPVLDHGETVALSEQVVLRPDGAELPVLKSVTSVARDGRGYLIESFIDISRLKAAQADLEASEAKYRQFFEEDLTCNLIGTPDGRILDCNPALAHLFGYRSVAETKAANLFDHYFTRSDREALLAVLQSNKQLERYEWTLCRRNGEPIHCIGNLIGVFDDQGQLTLIRAYIFDDTKRVQLEKEMLQAQKMEALGALAGGIAHDFNNILAGIMGYAEIVLRDLNDKANAASRQRLQHILTACDRARGLIGKMLTFSRQAETEPRPLRLRRTVEDVIQLIRASLPATIAIEQRFDSQATILADQIQIHQVVMNLCTNAGHAMREQGGVLSISLRDVALDEAFVARYPEVTPGNYVCLQVSDTGKGIPEHLLGRIFEPFFTTKQKGEGTGLGLSMIHGIVGNMNGLITVDSHLGAGTRFNIYLPRINDVEETAAMEHHAVPTGHEHIVYVDDEPFLVDIGAEILRGLGYRVTGFTESNEALAYLRAPAEAVDLVITDMTMPRLTGLELAKILCREGDAPPIIICTGHSEGLSLADAAPFGVRDFLQKPITVNKLAFAVRAVLDAVLR
jgi:PAS domain S-box-containing protein